MYHKLSVVRWSTTKLAQKHARVCIEPTNGYKYIIYIWGELVKKKIEKHHTHTHEHTSNVMDSIYATENFSTQLSSRINATADDDGVARFSHSTPAAAARAIWKGFARICCSRQLSRGLNFLWNFPEQIYLRREFFIRWAREPHIL